MSQADQESTDAPTAVEPLNPLICTCPSDTLSHCDVVLSFVSNAVAMTEGEVSADDVTGISFILDSVRNALQYERDRVQYQRKPCAAPVSAELQ